MLLMVAGGVIYAEFASYKTAVKQWGNIEKQDVSWQRMA